MMNHIDENVLDVLERLTPPLRVFIQNYLAMPRQILSLKMSTEKKIKNILKNFRKIKYYFYDVFLISNKKNISSL